MSGRLDVLWLNFWEESLSSKVAITLINSTRSCTISVHLTRRHSHVLVLQEHRNMSETFRICPRNLGSHSSSLRTRPHWTCWIRCSPLTLQPVFLSNLH